MKVYLIIESHHMTGEGEYVYAVYSDKEKAERECKRLNNEYDDFRVDEYEVID